MYRFKNATENRINSFSKTLDDIRSTPTALNVSLNSPSIPNGKISKIKKKII